MATVTPTHSTGSVDQRNKIWSGAFGPDERQHLLKEDSTALSSVSLELVAIVGMGFVLMAITLAAILYMG